MIVQAISPPADPNILHLYPKSGAYPQNYPHNGSALKDDWMLIMIDHIVRIVLRLRYLGLLFQSVTMETIYTAYLFLDCKIGFSDHCTEI